MTSLSWFLIGAMVGVLAMTFASIRVVRGRPTRAEAERLRVEATSGPSWDAVALRSALVAMTVERDEARATIARVREFIREHGTGWDAITTNGDDWAKRIIDILDREA